MRNIGLLTLTLIFVSGQVLRAEEVSSKGVEKASEPAKADGAPDEKDDPKAKGKKKNTMKLAEDQEDGPPPEKDPSTYELANHKMLAEYTTFEQSPYDRGEHIFISGFYGLLGGAVVGGLIGFSQFDQYNMTNSENSLYAFAGGGAAAGAIIGIGTTFFERGKIEQFAIGKFLLKYSWYGAVGGAILGAGAGFIPYSSSNDYSDIFRYGGYGAGIGFFAGLVLFAFDLPEHLRLYSWKREDQNMVALTMRF